MSDSFEVKMVQMNFVSGPSANVPISVLHVPSSAGAQTVLEAYFIGGTIGTLGTFYLMTGTAATSGTLGTANATMLGTCAGTGVGIFPAQVQVAFTLAASPVIPAGNWLGVYSNSGYNATGNIFQVSYVSGR